MSRADFTLSLSLLANAGLALVWWRLTSATPPASFAPPPLSAPVVARTEPAPPPPSVVAAPPLAVQPATPKLVAGTWARLFNAGDLRGSVLRLRATCCPEQTLRDLALAQFQRHYRNDVWLDATKVVYWKNPDWHSPELRQKQREIAARRRADGELSKELFGVDLVAEEDREVGFWDDRNANGNYLPAGTRDALQRFLESFEEKEFEMQTRNRGIHDAQTQREAAQLRSEKEKTIAALLSPAAFRQWELRESSTAESLQSEVVFLKLSQAEYEALFDRRKQLGPELELFEVPNKSRAETDRFLAANTEWEAAVKKTLGEARAREFERGKDYDYQQLHHISREFSLPETTAATVFDLRDAAQAKANELSGSDKLTPAQRVAAGAAIRAETEKALQQALGETLLKKYREQLNLHWLDALNPAPPEQ